MFSVRDRIKAAFLGSLFRDRIKLAFLFFSQGLDTSSLFGSPVRDRIQTAFLFFSQGQDIGDLFRFFNKGQDIGSLLILQPGTGYKQPFGSSVRDRKKPAFLFSGQGQDIGSLMDLQLRTYCNDVCWGWGGGGGLKKMCLICVSTGLPAVYPILWYCKPINITGQGWQGVEEGRYSYTEFLRFRELIQYFHSQSEYLILKIHLFFRNPFLFPFPSRPLPY